MTDTASAAAFGGAPASVLQPVKDASRPDAAPTLEGGPVPGGVAPTQRLRVGKAGKAAPAKAAAKRGRGRPKSAPKVASVADAIDAASEAAAAALERETAKRGPGRPSVAETKNAVLETGLVNFYVGIGGLLSVGGWALKNDRLRDVGAAMIAQSKKCAAALVAAADQSEMLRKALEYLTMAGGASLVLAAHGPILLAALGAGPPAADVEQAADSVTGEPAALDLGALMGMMSNLGALMGEPPAAA